ELQDIYLTKIFKNYKSASINNCIRSKEDLILPILNEIDGIFDLDILKNLKIFTVAKSLEELTKKIAEYTDEIMPSQFIQSMLILPKDQLHKYKLHKIVLNEYNEYIQETCQVVDDISNKLSTHVQSYSYMKNIKRKSRNSFPSFKNKLNKILLKYSNEFGFEKKESS
ncbi:13639_t:CDS:2, partial [Funneliformis geosporum]